MEQRFKNSSEYHQGLELASEFRDKSAIWLTFKGVSTGNFTLKKDAYEQLAKNGYTPEAFYTRFPIKIYKE
jgi:hypothetical protein